MTEKLNIVLILKLENKKILHFSQTETTPPSKRLFYISTNIAYSQFKHQSREGLRIKFNGYNIGFSYGKLNNYEKYNYIIKITYEVRRQYVILYCRVYFSFQNLHIMYQYKDIVHI